MFGRYKLSVGTITAHIRTENQAKNSAHFIVKYRLRDFSLLFVPEMVVPDNNPCSQILLSRSIRRCRFPFLHPNREQPDGYRALRTVAHHYPIEFPVSFQYFIQQQVIMTAMLPADLIVGTHNRPHFCFGNCSLECREIDFVQCTVTEVHIDMRAILPDCSAQNA